LRILIVADDPLVRAGLATLLENHPRCTVAGQMGSTADLASDLEVYQADLLVWDLGWSPTPDFSQQIDVEEAGIPVLALLPDDSQINELWSTGVQGVLLRDADADKLWAALQAIFEGLTVFDPELVGALLPARQLDSSALVDPPTPRELEVLQLLAEGLSNKAIAHQLGISEHTVKFHVNALLGKLGAQSRTEAVVRATRLGLLLL
jgi:DNA-binding NarL/FixJ family response regulator